MLRQTLLASAFLLASATGCHLYIDDGGEPGDSREPDSPCGVYGCGQDVPDASGPGVWCEADLDCGPGCYCDEGSCVETGLCESDLECADGFECDDRNSCVPEPEPDMTCQGEVLCDMVAPICPDGSTPAISDGCYTGACMLKADCPDGAPFACSDLGDEAACTANAECGPIYKGVNCTSADGSACTSVSADCTCESFAFDRCDVL